MEPNNDLHARMFWFDGDKFLEDSATGSANGCLLAYLLKYAFFGEGPIDVMVEQGFEIRRPSYIHLKGKKSEDYDLYVGGKVFLISQGTWFFD